MTTRFQSVAPPAVLFTALVAAPSAALALSGSGTTLHVECDAVQALTGSIGQSLALHADVDGRRDVATIVGDDVVILMGPDPHQYSQALGLSEVSAIAKLPGATCDSLLVAHQGGLVKVDRDGSDLRSFKPVLTQIGGVGWDGARSLVVVDIDGDSDLDVVGLDKHGVSVLVAESLGDGTFVAQPPLLLASEHDHLTPAPWGHTQVTFAAVASSAGVPDDSVVVFDLSGTSVASYVPGGEVTGLADLSGGTGGLGLAALAGDDVRVVRPVTGMEAPLDVSSLAPTALSVADYDGDGAADLLVNSTLVTEATVLLQQTSGGPSFRMDVGTAYVSVGLGLPEGGDMSGQKSNVVGADFDRDGDVDVLQMLECERSAVLVRNDLVDEDPMHPEVVSTAWTIHPSGSAGSFNVEIPQMPGGGTPDVLEVVLYTNAVGDPEGAPQWMRALVREDLDGYAVGDQVSVFIPFPGELGEESSVSVRCYEYDASGLVLVDCGVESAATYAYDQGGTRGSNGPIAKDAKRSTGKSKTPPPPPPTPIEI